MGKNEHGFTLVELMIGIAILVLIMSGIYGVLASSIKSYQYNVEQGKNIQDSRQIFSELTKGIRNAKAITIPPDDKTTLKYSIKDTSTGLTDTYVVSLNTVIKAVVMQKNNETPKNIGTERVDDINFFSKNSGNKKEINIQLFFRNSDSTNPLQTTVTTLNNDIQEIL